MDLILTYGEHHRTSTGLSDTVGRALAYLFELQDPVRPGSRKIMVLFLVNPERDPVVSMTFVPPQQAEWHPVIKFLQEIAPGLPWEVGQMIAGLFDRSIIYGLAADVNLLPTSKSYPFNNRPIFLQCHR
ncbi:hypothetical protein BGZ47_008657 [Haplosporangium gracile]|nr:hypothetical protein BGZ47_008657 [Haplosporangium gracile]